MMEDWALATLQQKEGLTAQNCGWFDRGSERHDHGVLFLKYISSILRREVSIQQRQERASEDTNICREVIF